MSGAVGAQLVELGPHLRMLHMIMLIVNNTVCVRFYTTWSGFGRFQLVALIFEPKIMKPSE